MPTFTSKRTFTVTISLGPVEHCHWVNLLVLSTCALPLFQIGKHDQKANQGQVLQSLPCQKAFTCGAVGNNDRDYHKNDHSKPTTTGMIIIGFIPNRIRSEWIPNISRWHMQHFCCWKRHKRKRQNLFVCFCSPVHYVDFCNFSCGDMKRSLLALSRNTGNRWVPWSNKNHCAYKPPWKNSCLSFASTLPFTAFRSLMRCEQQATMKAKIIDTARRIGVAEGLALICTLSLLWISSQTYWPCTKSWTDEVLT